jgi:hypothetical protein
MESGRLRFRLEHGLASMTRDGIGGMSPSTAKVSSGLAKGLVGKVTSNVAKFGTSLFNRPIKSWL